MKALYVRRKSLYIFLCSIGSQSYLVKSSVILSYFTVYEMNTYIVRSYRDVIVVTNIAARRNYKALSTVMY